MMAMNPYDREDTCTCAAWSEGECACGGYVDTGKIRAWQVGYDSAQAELAAALRDAAIYRDAFKDATIANTAASRRLAEQEAKTVEYRAAWIKAQRERDHYRALLIKERRESGRLEAEFGWVTE